MDSFYGIKLLNTLCVCMLLTDAALNRPHGPRIMPHHLLLLRLCLAANALAALAFVLQAFVSWPGVHLGVSQVVRAISLPITLVQMLSRFLGGSSVLSALVAALATALSWSAFKRSSQRPPFGYFIGWATLAVVLRLVQLLAGAEVPDEVVELLESMLVVASVFGLLSYWDVRHCVNDQLVASEFIGMVAVASAEAVLLLPVFTVLAACGCLAAVAASELLGLPTAWLSTPIYWACLYCPFGSVYFLTMRQARRSLLPR